MVCKIGPKQNPQRQEVKITMIINDQLMSKIQNASKGKQRKAEKRNKKN